MSIEKITQQLKQEIIAHRQQERELLEEISEITSIEFADKAAGQLDHRKQCYGLENYLELLSRLKTLLIAGMPRIDALEAVQTGISTEKIMEMWRG